MKHSRVFCLLCLLLCSFSSVAVPSPATEKFTQSPIILSADSVTSTLLPDLSQTDTLSTTSSGQVITVSKATTERINLAQYVLIAFVTFGGLITGLMANVKYLSTTVPGILLAFGSLYQSAVHSGGLEAITFYDLIIAALITILGTYLPGIEWKDILPKLLERLRKKPDSSFS